jgi:hypothetical protein
MRRCLVQKFVTVGQYNNGSIRFNDCALVEFPAWDAPFADVDNDGVYMTGGDHYFTDTFIGWALDDSLDAGSGAGGYVTLSGCWLESSYHEAMAWSNSNGSIPPRVVTATDTVTMNSGQGIECGFGEPEVTATHCFSTGNAVGARFGDNYDWSYNGFLTVTDSLLLYNLKDVWGWNRDEWTVATDKMSIMNNHLSKPNTNFPTNTLWDPIADPNQTNELIPFLPTPATAVGIGLATYQRSVDITDLPGSRIPGSGIGVRLSTFTTRVVSVNYTIETNGGPYDSGTLQFAPGQTVREIPFAPAAPKNAQQFDVTISSPVNAEITGFQQISVTVPPAPYKIKKDIISVSDDWLYRKGLSEPPSNWNELGFTPDGSWLTGPTPIGYENNRPGIFDCLATDIIDMRGSYWSIYARYTFTIDNPSDITQMELGIDFDDGYMAYLNGVEVDSQYPPVIAAYDQPANTSNHEAYCPSSLEPRDLTDYISLLVAGENVLAFQVHNATLSSSDFMFVSALSIVTAPTPGDVEPDGDIDLDDLAAMAVSWLASTADSNYDGFCDINDAAGDGIVNLLDFRVLAANWLAGL